MFFAEYVQKWGIRIFYVIFSFFMVYRLFFAGGTLLERSVSYVTYPFLQVHSGIVSSVDGVKNYFHSLDSLKKELQDSKQVVHDLESRIIELEQLEVFQEDTRELVAYAQRYKESFHLLSKVLLRRQNEQEHLLYLDVGTRQGVQKNMVVVFKNCLIGRVTQAYPLYSEVAFITDRRCKVTVDVYKKKIQGIYEGLNREQGTLKFIPHFKTVEAGDRLYSAGSGLIYPQGFLVGEVAQIKSGAVDLEISVQPPVDFEDVRYVYVIKQ